MEVLSVMLEKQVKIIYLGVSIVLMLLCLLALGVFIFIETDLFPVLSTLCLVVVIFYLKKQTNSFFSPASIFFGFYWLMLIGRPLIYNLKLSNQELVSASSYNLIDVGYVNLIICVVLIFIIIFLISIDILIKNTVFDFPNFELSKKTRIILISLFIIAGVSMLIDGFRGFNALKNANYVELIETGELVPFSQLSYTILKWSWFFLFITYKNRSKFICIAFLIFLSSLPMTGMRGYFIIYVLLALVFLDAKKAIKLKLSILIPFVFILLTATTFLLEYRLGFKVAGSGFFDPFFDAIFSQGATYEVVYGAYTYNDQVSFLQNVLFPSLFNNPPFGTYIDILRGVSNGVEDIGFATSAIAELISAGPLLAIIYISILAFSIKILNVAYINVGKSNGFYFVLFFISPVIWGQPRGALLQFIIKFVFLLLLWFLVNYFKLKKIRI